MAVQYSPLCNTSLAAYLAYCFANHGSSVGRVGESVRGVCGEKSDSSICDDGVEVAVVASVGRLAGQAWLDDVCQFGSVVGAVSVGDNCVGSVESGVDRVRGGSDVGVSGNRDSGNRAGDVDGSANSDSDCVEVTSVEVAVEPSGGLKGKWYEHNKKKKERRKLGKSEGLGKSVELQRSLERKWTAENALAEEKARQQLELLQARDVESMKRMQRAQVMRTTEVCKVQTEKAFSTLRRTGNAGSVETVVSTPSMTNGSTVRSNGESVSPDSSISQSEIRQMQKEIIDLKREGELAEKAFAKLAQIDARAVEMAREQAGIKTAFTVDTEGEPPINAFGEMRADGKFHTREVTTCHASNPCYKQKYEVWDEQQRELEQRLADLGI